MKTPTRAVTIINLDVPPKRTGRRRQLAGEACNLHCRAGTWSVKKHNEGVDLEMDKDGIHYVVSIKSGPNWSNSSSMKKQIDNFMKASRIYRTSGNKLQFAAIEGCCYGKDHSERNSHTKICGQEFWEFISGSSTLYTDIIEPLGTDATAKNDEYKKKYDQKITLFTCEFSKEYCDDQGNINRNKIVEMNSSKRMRKTR